MVDGVIIFEIALTTRKKMNVNVLTERERRREREREWRSLSRETNSNGLSGEGSILNGNGE